VLRRFLISTGSNVQDRPAAEWTFRQQVQGTLKPSPLREHQRRLLRYYETGGDYPVWEGLHWVLDLLPDRPRQALAVLDSFYIAMCQSLSDGYATGLFDAKTIIRQRFIQSPGTVVDAKTTLASLEWRELEWLAGALYERMGYTIQVTPRSDDDGVDVLVTSSGRGDPRRIVVQTKKRTNNPIEKAHVRELVGAIDQERATGGVLITTGRFRSGALGMKASDPRIDLIDGNELVGLLNEHCGTDWYNRVDFMISEIKRSAGAMKP